MRTFFSTLVVLFSIAVLISSEKIFAIEAIDWKVRAELPRVDKSKQQIGYAGSYSGIISNYLIIAGGANFPDTLPWYGGKKKYHDNIFVYDLSKSKWIETKSKLLRTIGYGVSVSIPQGVLCIGGNNGSESFTDVFLISFIGGKIEIQNWEPLPVPLSHMTGDIINNKIYIAGGIQRFDSVYSNHFFEFDILNRTKGWNSLPTWPGSPRAFAVSATQADGNESCFFLFSGRNVNQDESVEILKDGYKFSPKLNTWEKLDNIKVDFPVMAGTACSSGFNHILFFGGTNGDSFLKELTINSHIDRLKGKNHSDKSILINLLHEEKYKLLDEHPGFSKNVLAYNTITNTIFKYAESPLLIPVTTNLLRYKDSFILTSGEVSPGKRTPMLTEIKIKNILKEIGGLNTTVIVVYFLILVMMGYYFSKKQKNSNDYFKGGGRLPWWAVGLSVFGTGLSAITYMAIPAKAYSTDWSYILLNLGIVLIAPVIVYLFIPFYRRLNITTAYEYLELRFNLAVRLIGSLIFIIFQVGRMGIILFLPSIALNVITGMDIFICIGLMGFLSLLYTYMGGIEAVIWTDAFQVVILLGGAFLAIYIIASEVDGGMLTIITNASQDGKFNLGSSAIDFTQPTMWTVILASFFANITTYGTDQTMVQRYITTKDEKSAGKTVWTNAIMVIPATLIFFFIGSALYVYYKELPVNLSVTLKDNDAIFPYFIFNQMPDGIAGLLIAGIFAAAMSTLSSIINSTATAWSVDFHFRFGWSKNIDELKIARLVTIIIGALGISFAFLIATLDIISLWDEFQKILGIIMGGLGGLFSLGMFTKRANSVGAIAGLIGSTIIQLWLINSNIVHILFLSVTGYLSCFIIGYIASIIIPIQKNKAIEALTIYHFFNKQKKK